MDKFIEVSIKAIACLSLVGLWGIFSLGALMMFGFDTKELIIDVVVFVVFPDIFLSLLLITIMGFSFLRNGD